MNDRVCDSVLSVAPEMTSDAMLLSAVLSPTKAAAETEAATAAALASAGGIQRLARMSPLEVREALAVVGCNRGASSRVIAALELGRRAHLPSDDLSPVVRGLADVEPIIRREIGACQVERFIVLLLDARNRVVRVETVSVGCLTWSVVHPREVYAAAVRERAGAIIVAHNHPSGDPTPSPQDAEVTGRLSKAGEILGIPLLDHVVIGKRRAVSMRAQGLMGAGGSSFEP